MTAESPSPDEQLAETMARIYRRGLTTASGGNLSIHDRAGVTWITPARLDKGTLASGDMVHVRPDGSYDGAVPPSSELPFHAAIYAARPDVRAVVHAHPVALVAFAVCHRAPDPASHPIAARRCRAAGFVPYERTGTDRLASRIAETFADGNDAAILENHGVVVGGTDLRDAFVRFETLEWLAASHVRARALGGDKGTTPAIPPPACSGADPGAPPATEAERTRAAALVAFVRRACEHGLTTSADGTLSTRLDADRFAILAADADRGLATADDVRVASIAEAVSSGTRETAIHARAYAADANIGAVFVAAPVNVTAFTLTGTPLDMRMVSESYLVLRNIAHLAPDASPTTIASSIGPSRPAALVEGIGAVAVGHTMLEAFDRMEVLEATARVLIDAQTLGDPIALEETAVRDLDEHFPLR